MSNHVWLERAVKMYNNGNHRDGDMLSHDWLKYALDIPEAKTVQEANDVQWIALSRVDAFREWLLIEKKTALQSVRGEGYRIVPPSEQARVAAEEAMKLIYKGVKKGNKLLDNVRLAEMDDTARRIHTDTQIRMAGIGGMIKRQKRDVFAAFDNHSK